MSGVSIDITWHDGAYYVSVPNWKGGTVYTSEYVDSLRAQLEEEEANAARAWAAWETTRLQLDRKQKALDLAVNVIMANEPGDSRAVSNIAVALAAVASGDVSEPVMAVINSALSDDKEKS